jgi:hypothetical protein
MYLEVGRVIFFNLTLQTFWSNLNLKIPWIFLNELILIKANVRVEKCISTVQFQDKSDLGRLSLYLLVQTNFGLECNIERDRTSL